jgi:DNA-binding NtrC family response regulator
VLILGESGTGKGTVARELHRLSGRSDKVFAAADLPALPPTLFESELFGHKRGAFTDARTDRPGRFEYANGGTLFLDEIGSLPLPQQARLLTVLQQREVVPVGSNTSVPINVRVIAATSAPLFRWVEEGRFRQDLLYRLNTITLTLPPLRERQEDIFPLADHFLRRYQLRYGRESMEFSKEARDLLQRYHWPGNVRELEHAVEKAVILSQGTMILATDLNLPIPPRKEETGIRTLDELEKEALRHALEQHAGNIVHAARALGITRQTFYNKMKKYGI